MNLTVITTNPDGTVNATITLADGFTETIEGLHEMEYALTWSHMHLTRTNRHHRPNY